MRLTKIEVHFCGCECSSLVFSEGSNPHCHYGLLLYRGLFIIDAKGILRQITMNDLPVSSATIHNNDSGAQLVTDCVHPCIQVGRSVDETLRLVQAFQYTDQRGEGVN